MRLEKPADRNPARYGVPFIEKKRVSRSQSMTPPDGSPFPTGRRITKQKKLPVVGVLDDLPVGDI